MWVASVTYDLPTDQTYSYTYDNMGNIATYTDANGTVTYTYDSLGQLTKAAGSTTYNYTYDNAGNILTGNGHTYTYGDSTWADLLTAVDGQTISYDGAGNPTSYYNGTRWTFTWKHGRSLVTAADGTNTISYTYDVDGLRTSKTVNGTKHTYYYAGGKLLRETYGSNTLDFFYDASGNAYALKHNGTLYYYITNLQGDVMSIVNGSGTVVASYSYDPYGNVLTATGTMAAVNPLRYRGYYYDSETGFYYLQSRYYDPELGRFINADAYASTGQGILGNNMFAYCGNNPINSSDPCGTCRHRLDFWNDCEKCGGKTWKNKLDDFATMVVDYHTMVQEDQRKQIELQLELVKTVIDIQVRTEQAIAEQQRMQDVLVGKFVADRFSTLEKAANTLTGVGIALDTGAAYLGGVAAGLSIPTLGLSAVVAGKAAAVLSIASIPFYAAAWVLNLADEE